MNEEAALERANCDLCGCSSHRVLFKKKDTTSYWLAKCAEDQSLDAQTEFPVVQCTDCKHTYVTPRLKPEIISDIYARFWRSYEPRQLRQDPFAMYVSRQLAAALARPGRLLDFGSGWGHYLAAARATGWDGVGIEVDQAKIDFARKHGLNVVRGDLLDRQFDESSFDAVVAQQVFEHLYDPVSYLKEINRILRPGGILFVGVPNYGGLNAKFRGPRWEMISPVAHVRYFTRHTLGRFLSDHGFSIVRRHYLRRFAGNVLKELVYQSIVLAENELNLYPHALSLYARKQ